MRGRRLQCEEIAVGETYNFQDCAVREFSIIPQDGSRTLLVQLAFVRRNSSHQECRAE